MLQAMAEKSAKSDAAWWADGAIMALDIFTSFIAHMKLTKESTKLLARLMKITMKNCGPKGSGPAWFKLERTAAHVAFLHGDAPAHGARAEMLSKLKAKVRRRPARLFFCLLLLVDVSASRVVVCDARASLAQDSARHASAPRVRSARPLRASAPRVRSARPLRASAPRVLTPPRHSRAPPPSRTRAFRPSFAPAGRELGGVSRGAGRRIGGDHRQRRRRRRRQRQQPRAHGQQCGGGEEESSAPQIARGAPKGAGDHSLDAAGGGVVRPAELSERGGREYA